MEKLNLTLFFIGKIATLIIFLTGFSWVLVKNKILSVFGFEKWNRCGTAFKVVILVLTELILLVFFLFVGEALWSAIKAF